MLFFRLLSRPYEIVFKLCLAGLVSLLFCDVVKSETTLSKKSKLKAAYLLNFTQFIEWPNIPSGQTPSTIRICVDDSSEFILFLNQVAEKRKVGKLQQTVKALPLNTAAGCELIYVKNSGKEAFEHMSHTVIVTDSDEISFPNSAIVFFEQNEHLRFEINLKQIDAMQVTVSSELLKLARIK